MNKNIIIVILISLLPFVFMFSTTSFLYTQDGWTHLARAGAYVKALTDGQFPVRWAGDLNYSYGMPLFNFVFHVPYMVMSLFIFLGTGLVNSLKVTTLISFVFSGIFMYLFAREFFKDEKKALLVTVFYQFFPYHLIDILVRGSMGEMFTFTFLPLILYGITLFNSKSSIKALLFIALGTAGMVLSHLATGAVLLVIAGIFILLFTQQMKKMVYTITAMLAGVGLSAYYWIPAFLDHKYTYGSLFVKDLYADHFVPFVNFFIPNIGNNPALRTGDVPIEVGLFHSLAIIVAVGIFFFSKKVSRTEKKIILFCFGILVVAFFIMQPGSKIIWESVPLFEQFQFPWRFLGAVGFATSMLAVYFLSLPLFKKKIIFPLLLIFVISITAVYWYPQLGFRKIDENYYWNYPLDTTYFGETNIIWSAGPASAYPKKSVEVISGKATVTNIKKKSNLHSYAVSAKTESNIIDHTQFFPGWKVFVDGKSVPIQFQDPNHRGEIIFIVPPGEHTVVVMFGETKIRMIANSISVIFLVFVGVFFIIKRRKKAAL